MLPLIAGRRSDGKPLGGTCMTSAGEGGGVGVRLCAFLDDKMAFLREETRAARLPDAATACTAVRATCT